MLRLGNMYFFGEDGISKNLDKACEWYKEAYKHRECSDDVINNMARSYSGNGNNAEAIRWWHIGEEHNYPMCISNLGWAYRWGKGVSVDYKKAMEYFHKAIEAGSYNEYKMSPTSISGGGKLLTGGELISPASLKGQEEVLPSAKLEQWPYNGVPEGNIADMYLNGNGVNADYAMARTWYLGFAPFLSSEIYSFQGNGPIMGVGSLSNKPVVDFYSPPMWG